MDGSCEGGRDVDALAEKENQRHRRAENGRGMSPQSQWEAPASEVGGSRSIDLHAGKVRDAPLCLSTSS